MRPFTRSLAALAILACGCGGGARTAAVAPSNTPAETPAAPITEPDGLVVHARGAAPHAERRYRPAGAQRKVEFATRQEIAVNGADPQVVDVTMRWTFELVPAAGGTTVRMAVDEAPGPMRGLSAEWTLSERGHVSPMGDALDARLVLQQSQAEHLLPVFPSTAVGVGARWTLPLLMSSGVGRDPVKGTTAWELVEVSGSTVRARATLDIPRTKVPFNDAVMDFAMTGTLDTRVDLTTLASQSDLRLTINGEIPPDVTMLSKSTIAQTIR